MSKVCVKCGLDVNEDDVRCKFCGALQNETNIDIEILQRQIKEETRKKIRIFIVLMILIVLIVTMIALIISVSLSNKTPETDFNQTIENTEEEWWVYRETEENETLTEPVETVPTTECSHIWNEATCWSPKKCSICGIVDGDKLQHEWLDATYDDPKTCALCGETEGSPLERPEIEVNFSTELPQEFVRYWYADELKYSIYISEVTYSYEKYILDEDKYEIYLYFTGEKTYDRKGDNHSEDCSVGIKIYDDSGENVIYSTTFDTPALKVGDKIKKQKMRIATLPKGSYTIELLSTS